MKQQLIAFSCLCFSLGLSTLPAAAQIFGPRGGNVSGDRIVRHNRAGGHSRVGRATVHGPYGGTSSVGYGIHSDDHGNVVYGRHRSSTGPNGKTRTVETTKSGQYSRDTGYTGQRTRTVNGQTYSASKERAHSRLRTPMVIVKVIHVHIRLR